MKKDFTYKVRISTHVDCPSFRGVVGSTGTGDPSSSFAYFPIIIV